VCAGLPPGQPGIAPGVQPQMVATVGAPGQRLPFAATPAAARPIHPVSNQLGRPFTGHAEIRNVVVRWAPVLMPRMSR